MNSHIIVAIIALVAGVMIGFMAGVAVCLRTAIRAVRQPPTPIPAVLCFICAAITLLAAIGTGIYSAYFLCASSPTNATIFDVREQKDSEGHFSRFPVYRYTDTNGTEHRDTTNTSDGREFAVGDIIPVRYLRSSPGESRIDYFTYHWLLPFLLAGVSPVTAAIGGALFWNYKRQMRSSPNELTNPIPPNPNVA